MVLIPGREGVIGQGEGWARRRAWWWPPLLYPDLCVGLLQIAGTACEESHREHLTLAAGKRSKRPLPSGGCLAIAAPTVARQLTTELPITPKQIEEVRIFADFYILHFCTNFF